MNKSIKRFLLSLVLFAAILLFKNTSVFAAVDQETAFNEFVNKKYESTYNLYLGEKIIATSWDIKWYLQPTITISNQSIVGIENKDELKAKKLGSTNVTVQITFNGQTETKKFKINVIQSKLDTKLDSNTNDVISFSPNSDAKNQILLANNELWNTNKKSFKLTSKETGNVSKYVYSSVYYEEGSYVGVRKNMITSTLKKDNKLTVKNMKESLSVSKVKDISSYGYLTKSGNYYMYYLKEGNLKVSKKITGVSSLKGDYLLIKNGKTYAISGKKIFDFEIADADSSSSCSNGLVLDKKGNLYYYYFDYGNLDDYFSGKSTGKYIVKKVETKVKCLLGNNLYKTKSGKIKKYTTNEWDNSTKYIKTVYLDNSNYLGLKHNNKLYLNNVYLLNNVDDIYYANGSKYQSALIVRKDGSIWKLDLNGKSKLSKIRSGKLDDKRISKPTNVTATKSGKNNVKIKWNKVEGSEKYTIYRSTSKNGKYKEVGTSKTNSFKDKGIEVGKTYYYKVVANHSDSSFDSKKSSYAKIKIPTSPTKLDASKKSKTSFKVSFKKVSDISGYEIEYSTNKDFKKSTVKDTTKTYATIKGLKKNKTYYIRVRAYKIINSVKIYSSYTSAQKVVLK